jgi:dTDP-4-dehydrorhamnose reductase
MRIAVLGAAGQLGRDLCPRLAKIAEIIPLSRADIDLRLGEQIARTLEKHEPDIFVNCAAYNFVDKAETERDEAFGVNAHVLETLVSECAAMDIRFVHFSTDYVFGQNTARSTPYTEDEPPGPVSVYGQSKLRGERVVEHWSRNNLIIRTCGLYGVWGSGGKGGNFVETMLRLAGQGKPLRVVNDQRCTPSYTADVADATVQLLLRDAKGLFHVTNSGDCTWYEFAAEIFDQSGLKPDLTPITTAEFGAAAKRPAYSVLSSAKLAALLGSPLRAWQDALAAYLAERSTKS